MIYGIHLQGSSVRYAAAPWRLQRSSSTAGDNLWRGMRGKNGMGTCNEAGEKLLEFCAVNNLTIMNTWFIKKPIYLATWKHPATKQMHMIDYVMTCAEQRMFCTDVQVMRGASCWSDHHMVRVKVRMELPRKQTRTTTLPIDAQAELKEVYQQKLDEYLSAKPHNHI